MGAIQFMAAQATDVVIVPRNFRLLDEYDAANGKNGATMIHDPRHAGFISYGADESKDDLLLHNWEGMIIGPQATHLGEFMYSLQIFVPDEYPKAPPQIKFTAPQIRVDCVGPDGRVNVNKIQLENGEPYRYHFEHSIADVLMAIRSNMH